jgi:F-type H+-transporting ATPase subunit b
MKRFALVALLLGLACSVRPVFAQEPEGAKAEKTEKEESFAEKHELELKIANFVILAGLIGYFIGKNAGPFFAARSAGIRKDMDESLRQSQEAQARAAEVDQRLARLEADIAALRAEGEKEIQAETERMSRHTADEIAKIQAHAEREIASAGKAARMDLKRYSAELAMSLAEQKVRARMTPDAQDAMVQGFVQDLK